MGDLDTDDEREHLEDDAGLVTWAPSPITLQNMRIDPGDVVRFLARLAVSGNISDACRYSRVSRATINRMRKEIPEFRTAFAHAVECAADVIDAEVYRRGVRGIKRKVFQGGKQVDMVRDYSDRLLELRARAMHPAYKDVGKSSINVNAQAAASSSGTSGPPVPPLERGADTPDHVLTLGEGIAKLVAVAEANAILPGNMRVVRDDEPPDSETIDDDLGLADDDGPR